MRKRLLIPFLLGLVLAGLIGVSLATPIDQLTTLADYFPEDTPLFITVRTDAGYIETLDGVLTTIDNNLGGRLGGATARDLLDMAALSLTGQDYDTAVASWLGDSIAIGVTSFDWITNFGLQPDDVPFVLALESTDRELAEAFAQGAAGSTTGETVGDFTVYLGFNVTVAASDDVILMGASPTLILALAAGVDDSISLGSSDIFTETMDALPNGSYDIALYINGIIINQQMSDAVNTTTSGFGLDFSSLMGASQPGGTAAMGFTIVDGRSFVLDVSSVFTDEAVELQRSVPGYIEQFPLNLEFAGHIPARNGQLVVLDNAFGPDFLAVMDSLNTIGPAINALVDVLMDVMTMQGGRAGMAETMIDQIDWSTINFGGIVKQWVTQVFAGFTGLNLEHDVLTWMTGDYATYLALIPVESDLGFSLDIGLVTENTDPDAAAYISERLARASDLYGTSYTIEDIGGGSAIYMHAPLRALLTLADEPIPSLAAETAELDLVVGMNDDVFVASSRPGAEFALNPDGDSLLDDEAFAYAMDNLFLEDTVMVFYFGTDALVEALPAINGLVNNMREIQQAQFALSQIESMTITGNAPSDNVTNIRITLTIPPEVNLPEPAGAGEAP